jgi:integrase/recombinase XerD
MDKYDQLGSWIRRFLLEYLIKECNLSPNTQRSYRDALAMLLPFVARQLRKPLDCLEVGDLSGDHVRQFLNHLEQTRHVTVATRNQRLAAIHSLARFIAEYSPQHVAWYGEVRTVAFKKTTRKLIPYLEKPEVESLLASPDRTTNVGRRNYALLLFLYNSGARVSEAANLCIADLDLGTASHANASVRILGKGRKIRRCPLWPKTATELAVLVEGRPQNEHVFINQRGEPLTRFGVYNVLQACVARASASMPSLRSKRISPHTIRHSTATHLLRAGVDLNTIRSWLGHVSIDTTQVYAEIDLEMKARALEKCNIADVRKPTRATQETLMGVLAGDLVNLNLCGLWIRAALCSKRSRPSGDHINQMPT